MGTLWGDPLSARLNRSIRPRIYIALRALAEFGKRGQVPFRPLVRQAPTSIKKSEPELNLYIASFARLQSVVQRGAPTDLPVRQRSRDIEKKPPISFKGMSL